MAGFHQVTKLETRQFTCKILKENKMAERDAAPAKSSRPKPSHPSFFLMAKTAITDLADKKGSSVPSIQTYISGKYNLDIDFVKIHLKPALAKGIENKTFVRPRGSEAKGYTGRFKINKVKQLEEAKVKAKKDAAAKTLKKATATASKTKTTTKTSATKSKTATKSREKTVKKKTPTKTTSKSPKAKAKPTKTKPGTPKKPLKKPKVLRFASRLPWNGNSCHRSR